MVIDASKKRTNYTVVSIRDFSSNPRDHLSAEEAEEARVLKEAQLRGSKIAARYLFPLALLLSFFVSVYSNFVNPPPVSVTELTSNYSFDCTDHRKSRLIARTSTGSYRTKLNRSQCQKLLLSSYDQVAIIQKVDSSYVTGIRGYSEGQFVFEEERSGPILDFITAFWFLSLVASVGCVFAPKARRETAENR